MNRRKQRTIARPFEMKGMGIHSGKAARLLISPGPEDQGIIFIRDGVKIPASTENILATARCTCLGVGGVTVSTVEHLCAACMGHCVDNLTIEIDQQELPIFDGSGLLFSQKLIEAGFAEQEKEASAIEITGTIMVEECGSYLVGMPSSRFSMTVVVDYNHPVIGVQGFHYSLEEGSFEKELAPARTFGFKEELEALLEKNLALGGSLENALVVEKDGYMNPLRFPDEVVRHKSLDLLGDLALAGMNIKGHVMAFKPGHYINSRFTRELIKYKKPQ